MSKVVVLRGIVGVMLLVLSASKVVEAVEEELSPEEACAMACACCLVYQGTVELCCEQCAACTGALAADPSGAQDLAQTAASPWLSDTLACATLPEEIDTCVAGNVPETSPGHAWTVDYDSGTNILSFTNEGVASDDAMVTILSPTGRLELNPDEAVVTLGPGETGRISLRNRLTEMKPRAFLVYSADGFALNGDGAGLDTANIPIVPTLTGWGLMVLFVLMTVAFVVMRRRRVAQT